MKNNFSEELTQHSATLPSRSVCFQSENKNCQCIGDLIRVKGIFGGVKNVEYDWMRMMGRGRGWIVREERNEAFGKAYRESCDSFEAATISLLCTRCFGEDDVALQCTCLVRHSNSENYMDACGLDGKAAPFTSLHQL